MQEVWINFIHIMSVQQTSLDFFNTPPEEKKPAEKTVVREKEKEKTLTPIEPAPDHGGVEEVMERMAEPVPVTIDAAEPALTGDMVDVATDDEIVIDAEVRELASFVVRHKATQNEVMPGKKSTRGRIRLSDMDNLVDLVDVPSDDILFAKRYYSIGAVSDMFKVNISLIRFWENEFDILKPKKNAKGDRLFRPEDIKNLQLIYHLLREKKYTIDGAKDFLKNNKKAEESFAVIDALKKIKLFLLELKSNL